MPSANEVKQARQRAGLTQQEAADLVGISVHAWRHYEHSIRNMPVPTWTLFNILIDKKP